MIAGQAARSTEALGLIGRARRGWARDSHLGLVRRLEKALQLAVQLMRARYALKTCDRVGVNARVAGALRVQNHGSIVVGDHLNINSVWVPTELVTGPAGYIEIGDDVLINFGTVIAAGRGVSIGSGSMIGPHCIISDMDIPEAVDDPQSFLGKPIFIGKDVWLAGRVTVRPGVTIGDGAVVAAGSIVESDVPANVMALGIPARLLPKLMTAPRPTPEAEVSPSGEPIARRYAVPLDKRVRETAVEGAGSHDEAARRVNGTLISDFALDELAQELAADERTAVAVEFLRGDVAASLALEPKFDARDFAVVWTTPQGAIPAFSRLLTGERVDEVELSADVDAFCASIERSASRFRYVFVPSWTQPAYVREGGLHESRPGGAFLSLSAMNLRLMTQLSRLANVFVLNAARWQAAVGPSAANPRGWYLSRIAASRPLIVEAALDIRAALESLCGRRRSLLVLTSQVGLWGAVTSEPAREAYADFQQTLRQLARNGVALAMVGTGDESTLRREVALQAGWTLSEDILFLHGGDGTDDNPHLRGIADRRGVGLDAVVFLTANDAARAAVRTAVPSVYVPDWPESKLLYPSALQALRCFAAARSAAAGVN